MDGGLTIPILIALIVAVVAIIGIARQRHFDTTTRGSEPGKGYHTLESNYSSGLGGNDATWRVPRDPQEYARRFVPGHARRGTDKKGQSR